MPKFPDFKPVTVEDQAIIRDFTTAFPPYSDFNYISFFTWDTAATHAWCTLNGNLVLRLSDYLSDHLVFTILGDQDLANSVAELGAYVDTIPRAKLKLIPHSVASKLSTDTFTVSPDPDNFDYLFSISNLAALAGNAFKSKRHEANRCRKQYPDITVETATFSDAAIVDEMTDLLHRWFTHNQPDTTGQPDPEWVAITNLLTTSALHSQLQLTIARHNGAVVGFSVDELIDETHVLSHYFKTDLRIKGLGAYFNRTIAETLHGTGRQYWNWEQDLGVSGLKRMKRSYRPVQQLYKYTVTLR